MEVRSTRSFNAIPATLIRGVFYLYLNLLMKCFIYLFFYLLFPFLLTIVMFLLFVANLYLLT